MTPEMMFIKSDVTKMEALGLRWVAKRLAGGSRKRRQVVAAQRVRPV